MVGPTILLVESDLVQTQQLIQALGQMALPRPAHVSTGEAALEWLETHDCDACVLDYRLSGVDGLETLARIRQRKPAVPVIVVAAAESAGVAAAAFRAGALDFVPKHQGYADVVARLAARLVRSRRAAQELTKAIRGPGVPAALLTPTYENRLRAIGWRLDADGYRNLYLLEVAGGFVGRAVPPGGVRVPEALEFPDRTFPTVIALAIQTAAHRRVVEPAARPRLLPMGYEDFLLALGRRLDGRGARAITVAEFDDFVAVCGLESGERTPPTAVVPFRRILRAEDLVSLVGDAFTERAPIPFEQLAGGRR
ncbi:MAG TPA: response regulator [Thermomicrobiaceae bacterium]|nr:response regulator [Thermomicrobiaceae bacterium]